MMNNNNLADYGISDQMTMIYVICRLIGTPRTGKVNPDMRKLEMKKTISSKTGVTFEMTEHPLTMLDTDPRYHIEKKCTKVPRSKHNKCYLKSHLRIAWFKAHPPDEEEDVKKKAYKRKRDDEDEDPD